MIVRKISSHEATRKGGSSTFKTSMLRLRDDSGCVVANFYGQNADQVNAFQVGEWVVVSNASVRSLHGTLDSVYHLTLDKPHQTVARTSQAAQVDLSVPVEQSVTPIAHLVASMEGKCVNVVARVQTLYPPTSTSQTMKLADRTATINMTFFQDNMDALKDVYSGTNILLEQVKITAKAKQVYLQFSYFSNLIVAPVMRESQDLDQYFQQHPEGPDIRSYFQRTTWTRQPPAPVGPINPAQYRTQFFLKELANPSPKQGRVTVCLTKMNLRSALHTLCPSCKQLSSSADHSQCPMTTPPILDVRIVMSITDSTGTISGVHLPQDLIPHVLGVTPSDMSIMTEDELSALRDSFMWKRLTLFVKLVDDAIQVVAATPVRYKEELNHLKQAIEVR